VILDKPEPEVHSGATADRASGRIILKAVLCPNGTVGRIGIVVGLSNGMNDRTIKAAKKIKFEAATKDGSPVAQDVQLEYIFRQP
jgi:protein TonB